MEKQKKQSLVAAPGGKSYLVPFILITSLFLLWGFAHGLLDVLNKHFQGVFTMTKAESGYEEKNVEALLRTKIQQCKQTMFIFSGSKRHLMSNMFNSSFKPFYQSAISIGLEPIPIHIYVEFANRLFEQRGKLIDKSVIEEVYRMFDGYTWFVQMIMNELFALTEEGERCGMDKIEIARKNVILTQESSYKDLLANLAPKQKLVLWCSWSCICSCRTSAPP